jgi:hypothetical protein
MNGDRPSISLDPSADGVSYAPVLHALKITTIAGPRNAASTRDEVLNSRVLPPRQNFPQKYFSRNEVWFVQNPTEFANEYCAVMERKVLAPGVADENEK